MRLGGICGIGIAVSPWFFALLACCALAGRLHETGVLFCSVLWHETAHVLAARAAGYDVREVELLPFGGVAKIERLTERGAAPALFVLAAGPLASTLLMLCFWEAQTPLLVFAMEANRMLAAFNLLPALPLDGGRIAQLLLALSIGYQKATRCAVVLSYAVGGACMLKAMYDLYATGRIDVSLACIAVLLCLAASRERKGMEFRVVRLMARRKAELAARGYMRVCEYAVRREMCVKDFFPLVEAGCYGVAVVLDERFGVCGRLTETQLWQIVAERGLGVQFGQTLQPEGRILTKCVE